MRDSELETRLRAANLSDSEIAPLSPEKSAAILAHALATARRPDRGHRHPLYLLSGWRPLAAAFTAMGVFVMFQRMETPSVPPHFVTTISIEQPVAISTGPTVIPAVPPKRDIATRSELLTASLPIGDGRSPHIRRGNSSQSEALPLIRPHRLWAETAPRPHLPRETATPDTVAGKSAKTPDSDGPMLVAATGVPDDDSGDLHITVHENVPDSVPGRAEAAAIRMYSDTQYQATPTDYWAHARISSNAEPTLTLTALR